MRLLDRIRKAIGWQGSDRELSDRIDEVEEPMFSAMPWLLELPEEHQDELIQYMMRAEWKR